jgi:hypothetical protein
MQSVHNSADYWAVREPFYKSTTEKPVAEFVAARKPTRYRVRHPTDC